jgi:hypothetical protein
MTLMLLPGKQGRRFQDSIAFRVFAAQGERSFTGTQKLCVAETVWPSGPGERDEAI